jgi:tetratricopeptide (TPR) repeat protein
MNKRFTYLVQKYLENELEDSEIAEFETFLQDSKCAEYLRKTEKAEKIIDEGFKLLFADIEKSENLIPEQDEIQQEVEKDFLWYQANGINPETRRMVSRMQQEMLAKSRKEKLLPLKIISVIAAAAAITIGVAYFLGAIQSPSLHKLYSCYYKPNSIILTRHFEKYETQKIKLYNAYISADYYTCAEYCRKMIATDSSDEDVLFTYGICLMEMDSTQAAIQQFTRAESAVGINDGILFVFAAWYRAMCYLDMGDKESALRELKRLRESENGFKGIVRGEELWGRLGVGE